MHIAGRRYTVTLYNSNALETEKVIEQRWILKAETNEELITRYSTSIGSGNTFFTDNGIEMIPRKYKSDKPAQMNYYPTPSMAYIEDPEQRLTVWGGVSFSFLSSIHW